VSSLARVDCSALVTIAADRGAGVGAAAPIRIMMWMRMLSVALLLPMMMTLIVCGCDDIRRWCWPPNPEIDVIGVATAV
jgi:hypothetical protein